MSDILLNTSGCILGTTTRKNWDWFDEQVEDIHHLLEEKRKAHQAVLTNSNSLSCAKLAEIRSRFQRETMSMQNEWWTKLAGKIQGFANAGDQQKFYSSLRREYGPQRNTCPIRNPDRFTLITEKSKILDRWVEHYKELLNRSNPTDPTFLEDLPNLSTLRELDDVPTRHEVHLAISSLKSNKAAGPDGIPAEILKYGGNTIKNCLHNIIQQTW
ncbi:uncharacterized protein LOC143021614 [Oratosquilla oratoria]|uniref:uncharacterized protein LOC143021614 n=1 Tax=Oratosquilla oratoria TaxID=337810 RepID=UPI003F775D39